MTAAAAAQPDGLVSATVYVDPADPVFAGHYPGFPILPGLFLVEHVHRAVLATDRTLRLTALDKAKFRRPVRPGDTLSIAATLTGDDEIDCVATVSTAGGPAAELRLCYRRVEPGGQP